jgi:hypothetical protein
MDERPEDFFTSESDLPSSTSQELAGLRHRLVALEETRAVPQRLRWPVLAALGLVLVAAVIGVLMWAQSPRPPQQAAPPAAAAVVPPQPPPDPAATVAAAQLAKPSTPAAPLTEIKKPSGQRPVRSVAPPAVSANASTPAAARPDVPASSALPPPPIVEPPAKAYAVTTADRRGVETAVERYRDGVTKLDAAAVRAVWPSANAQELAREFGQLQEQQVEFHSCDLDIKESTAAATCTGVAGYVQKIGNAHPRFDDRRWAFTLKRAGSDWLIQDVVIR